MKSVICIYDQLRTTHLERAQRSNPVPRIFYRRSSYDFDKLLATEIGATQSGVFRQVIALLNESYDIVEVNEPMFLRALPVTTALVIAARLRNIFIKRRGRIVAYSIENIPISMQIKLRGLWLSDVLGSIARRVSAFSYHSLDRIVFGTAAAVQAYSEDIQIRDDHPEWKMTPALETACPTCSVTTKERRVLFVGSFESRKGILELLRSWQLLKATDSTIDFCLMGKGPLLDQVKELSVLHGYQLIVDPPRASIHEQQAKAKVLVMPSVPTGGWREQIGLPILEGLSHGCEIVATSSNGMAPWLREHSHRVVTAADDIEALAEAQLAALNGDRTATAILADLPSVGGRAEAQEWLWEC